MKSVRRRNGGAVPSQPNAASVRFAHDVDLSDIAPMSARGAGSDRIASGMTHVLSSSTGTLVLWGEGMFSPSTEEPEIRVPARRWLVFEADGALTAHVSTPEGFEPYAVREGLIWGVYTDEVDVESIRAYQLSSG